MNVGFASTCLAYVIILSRFNWQQLSDRAVARALAVESHGPSAAADVATPHLTPRTREYSSRSRSDCDVELVPLTAVSAGNISFVGDDDNVCVAVV
jgi:hypothetical protein